MRRGVLVGVAALAEIKGALPAGCLVEQGHVTRAPAFQRQRHADQLGAHGIERCGLGIDGHDAGLAGGINPAFQGLAGHHQFVDAVILRLGRRVRRRGVGAGQRAEAAFELGDERAEGLLLEETEEGVGLGVADGEGVQRLVHRHVVPEAHQIQ